MQVIGSETRIPEPARRRVEGWLERLGGLLEAALLSARQRQAMKADLDINGAVTFLRVNVQGPFATSSHT